MSSSTECYRKFVLRRQKQRCAVCGKRFSDLELSALSAELHHVIPKSLGGQDIATNLAAVCRGSAKGKGSDQHSCHYRVHWNGYYKSRVCAPADYFKFSHGGCQTLHRQWAMQIESVMQEMFQ